MACPVSNVYGHFVGNSNDEKAVRHCKKTEQTFVSCLGFSVVSHIKRVIFMEKSIIVLINILFIWNETTVVD